jgi:phage portal protein BeeE
MSWNKALLDNAPRPSGALVYQPGRRQPGAGTVRAAEGRTRGRLCRAHANAGRPMLLEGGLDWKAMGLTPRDMDFIEAKNGASARHRARLRRAADAARHSRRQLTYANYQEANRAFCRLTVLPLVATARRRADRLAAAGLRRGAEDRL